MKGRKLQFKNTFKEYSFTTEEDELTYYAWQHVGFYSESIDWSAQTGWEYEFFVNNVQVATAQTQTTYQTIVSEADGEYMTIIGGYERANVIRGLYQGNLYNFWM